MSPSESADVLGEVANRRAGFELDILFVWNVFYVTGCTPWMQDKDIGTGRGRKKRDVRNEVGDERGRRERSAA